MIGVFMEDDGEQHDPGTGEYASFRWKRQQGSVRSRDCSGTSGADWACFWQPAGKWLH